MHDKKPSMSDLLKQKQERQQETYYQKHQGAQKGNPARGKEVNIGKNGSNLLARLHKNLTLRPLFRSVAGFLARLFLDFTSKIFV